MLICTQKEFKTYSFEPFFKIFISTQMDRVLILIKGMIKTNFGYFLHFLIDNWIFSKNIYRATFAKMENLFLLKTPYDIGNSINVNIF